jgi:hypothetical protein
VRKVRRRPHRSRAIGLIRGSRRGSTRPRSNA